jgi:hypothetical protein
VLWLGILKYREEVAGYDKTSTALTRELIDNGTIHFDDSIDLVPKDFFEKHFGYYYSCCS